MYFKLLSTSLIALMVAGCNHNQGTDSHAESETELLSIAEISSTARRTGRGELDEHSQTTNSAEIDVNFTLNDRSREEFMADVRSTLSGIPGIAFTVGQPLGHRIDHMLSGTRANIAVKLFGTDLNKMFSLGNTIKSSIIDVEGLVDVNIILP